MFCLEIVLTLKLVGVKKMAQQAKCFCTSRGTGVIATENLNVASKAATPALGDREQGILGTHCLAIYRMACSMLSETPSQRVR